MSEESPAEVVSASVMHSPELRYLRKLSPFTVKSSGERGDRGERYPPGERGLGEYGPGDRGEAGDIGGSMLVRLLGGATVSASPIALALRLRVAGPGLLGPGLLGRDRVLTPGLPGGLPAPSSAWDTEPLVRRGSGFAISSSSSSSESSSDGPFCLGGRPTRRWCPLLPFFLLNNTAVLRLTPDGDCCVLEVEVLRALGGEEGISSRSFMPGDRGDRGDRGSSKSTGKFKRLELNNISSVMYLTGQQCFG